MHAPCEKPVHAAGAHRKLQHVRGSVGHREGKGHAHVCLSKGGELEISAGLGQEEMSREGTRKNKEARNSST